MEYVKLGNTGLDVSRLCLGCMGFGVAERWVHPWVQNEESSRPIIKKALELGINFFDTANVYSDGTSEEIVGRALKDYANRDEIVLATKVHFRMHDGPNGAGLSRKAIMSEIDKSLKRLGTDYVDLYQIHRWDYRTPIEETMEALHDVVKAGKARYIGASAMYAWQFLKALHVAENNGWTRFVSMQNHYDSTADTDRQIVEEVAAIAEKRGVPRVQIALAWLLQKEPVTAPIIGATKISHLEDAVAALSIRLTAEEVKSLEAPYVPHRVVGAE
ncbi:aldo/keto reductase [Paenibacillus chibensis]|uniref:aldo/keto reductase n=1 Tax=Paenibacillus chibensis TaxID=59846 RepID=UPI000FDC806D|nr:aldo/keto reductase [Paenibacillus chibensis]MEC0372276.1 aldo/keto reductase [Paenibacillus chibensis]